MIQVYYTRARPPWVVMIDRKRVMEATDVVIPSGARLVHSDDEPLVPASHIMGWIETEAVVADGVEIREGR